MSLHKWDSTKINEIPCLRPGCSCVKRYRPIDVGGRVGHRLEISEDGGQSWGDLKAYQGRVPECRGRS